MVYYKPSTEQTAPAATTQTETEMTTTQPAQNATMKMEQQDAKRLRGGCGVSYLLSFFPRHQG